MQFSEEKKEQNSFWQATSEFLVSHLLLKYLGLELQ